MAQEQKMDWLGKIIDVTFGGIPGVVATVCPDHIRRQTLERLTDLNPFKTLSANHDLVRATRLAWIEATQAVLKEARQYCDHDAHSKERENLRNFSDFLEGILVQARDDALDRRKSPDFSSIDLHVDAVIHGVPELMSPGDHIGIGTEVTINFAKTLSDLTNWPEAEVPPIYQRIASAGLSRKIGEPPRTFGELVFAAFAELIKDPKKYPQAREAFYIAMDKLGRDIGLSTLNAIRGLQADIDAAISGTDALQVLRTGAFCLPLPRASKEPMSGLTTWLDG